MSIRGNTVTGPQIQSDFAQTDSTGADFIKNKPNMGEYAKSTYVNTSVSRAAPANLLDNSDFRNPVNQRGKTEYTSAGDIIDQWKKWTDNATVSLVTGGLKISENVYQLIEVTRIDTNKTHTVAIGYADGTSVCKQVEIKEGQSDGITGETIVFWTSGSTNIGFEIQNTSKIIAWAALYEGEYTADTLPVYKPKGYGAELAECQRYYQVRSTSSVAAADMRPTMRLSSPTVTAISGGYSYSADL